MNFKKIFFAVAAVAAAAFVSSCDPESTNQGDGKISIAETSLAFEIEGGTKTVTLHAGMDWELSGYTDEVKSFSI